MTEQLFGVMGDPRATVGGPMPEHRCIRCGQSYPPIFFRSNPDTRAGVRARVLRSVCIGCELTARTEAKLRDRPKVKARNTFAEHARRFVARGVISTPGELRWRYGWEIDRMAHDLVHVHENTCPYCWQPFAEMEHGLADVTLDVIDRDAEPYYRTNVRWCCATCNREKGTMAPADWALKLACWARWRERPPIADQLVLEL